MWGEFIYRGKHTNTQAHFKPINKIVAPHKKFINFINFILII